MTRIVAGSVGGRRIEVPRRGTRPTSERVRESLFGRLEHYGALDGTRVLDLCAGSGALGLEAASRGAGEVVLVDSSRTAVVPVHAGAVAMRICALSKASTAMASRAAGILRPITSSRCTVEPVEGRQWATATKRLVAVRAHRTRSETDRSAMTCQSAMS